MDKLLSMILKGLCMYNNKKTSLQRNASATNAVPDKCQTYEQINILILQEFLALISVRNQSLLINTFHEKQSWMVTRYFYEWLDMEMVRWEGGMYGFHALLVKAAECPSMYVRAADVHSHTYMARYSDSTKCRRNPITWQSYSTCWVNPSVFSCTYFRLLTTEGHFL